METRPPLLVDRRPAQPHEIWGSWRLAGAGGPSQDWSCRCKHCKKGWSGVGRSLQHLACWHQCMQRKIRASNSNTATTCPKPRVVGKQVEQGCCLVSHAASFARGGMQLKQPLAAGRTWLRTLRAANQDNQEPARPHNPKTQSLGESATHPFGSQALPQVSRTHSGSCGWEKVLPPPSAKCCREVSSLSVPLQH